MSNIITIAIVDDHSLFRNGLSMLIGLMPNYQVVMQAENGKDFIEQVGAGKAPDLVLLDIAMPEMDGYATAQWIVENYPETRILALSTMDSDTAIIKMIKAGAKGYILKDADTDELKLAFSELIAKGFFYNDLVSKKIVSSIHLFADRDSHASQLFKLTPRETEFLQLACSEKSYAAIASEMFVSERTVDGYREALFKKLNVTTRVGLVMYAIKNGMVLL
ncbi:response regulator transcription factor [Asinibacterium sp. OR53]|uniref:response regulator transcription factor n=1 Tax=Asinibacterium sp. OR53 TaxID=925409 RepID=UPI00047EDF68|nr:response regulator transcription factor [Asinibacterium sp. OR53]